MISALDHTTVLVRNLDAGIAAYRGILGRAPAFRAVIGGVESAFFMLENASMRISTHNGDGVIGDGVYAGLEADGEGLRGLEFNVEDVEQAHRRLKRLSLRPDEIATVTYKDMWTDAAVSWARCGLPDQFSNGIPISFSSPLVELPRSATCGTAPVLKMDLVVVATENPERALALYGARLGLDLIFDKTDPSGKSRLMQFACGDMLIEVVHRPTDSDLRRPDRLWGIAWSVADADAARERLLQAGRNVSNVKVGAKPGTRVFTLRDGTCNVATLFVQHIAVES